MKHSIYIHQNKTNLKIYVGYSLNYQKRWLQQSLKAFQISFAQYNEPFYRAIRKYGWDGFIHQIIEKFDNKEEALQAEKDWIIYFKSNRLEFGKDYGYNMHEGGSMPPNATGRTKSPEDCKQISERMKGVKQRLGQTNSPEHRAKISQSVMGHEVTDQTKSKISAATLGIKKDGSNSAAARTERSRLFTDEQIVAIKNDPRSAYAIAKEYGCSKNPIRAIQRGKVTRGRLTHSQSTPSPVIGDGRNGR